MRKNTAAAQMVAPVMSAPAPVPASTSFSVTLSEPVGPGGEAAARAKIYEAANNECKTAAKAFGKQCRIGTISIQTMPTGQVATATSLVVHGVLTLILE